MCTNSKYIVNPTKDFRYHDNLYILARCGECEECRTAQHNQMYMRLKREIEWCISNGYNIYFATLTYRNSRLPKMEVPIYDENGNFQDVELINCFLRSDWTKFYDDIRKPLCRKYSIGVNGSPRMRYFVACEYGSLRGRSHLHVLFAIPAVCPPQDFYDLVDKHWHKKNGKIFPQSLEGEWVYDEKTNQMKKEKPFQVNRVDCDYVKACYYCAKYSCKETFFYMNENIRTYLSRLRLKKKHYESLVKQKLADDELLNKYAYARNELKYVCARLPFHLCSRGFGMAYTEDFKDLTDIEICKKIEHGIDCISDNSEIFNFNYPDYIKTKLFYNVYILNNNGDIYDNFRDKGSERHVRRELNELGKLYKFFHHYQVIENCKNRFKNLYVELKNNLKYRIENNIIFPPISNMAEDEFFHNLAIYNVDLRFKLPIKFLRKFNSYNGYFSNQTNVLLSKDVFALANEFSIPAYESRKTFGLTAKSILKDDISNELFCNQLYFKNYEIYLNYLLQYESYRKRFSDKIKQNTRLKITTLIHN